MPLATCTTVAAETPPKVGEIVDGISGDKDMSIFLAKCTSGSIDFASNLDV